MKHLVELQSLSVGEIHELIGRADILRESTKESLKKILPYKKIGMAFYEPSTRTRWSFESAGLSLGCDIIGTENAREFSSAAKGESVEDSIRVMSSYVDAIVLRHYEEGAAERAAKVSPVPIINAGDGPGQHPTQALLDLYTIQRELERMEDFTIAMVGDLKNGRTVRSLCYLLGKFQRIRIIFISPEPLAMKADVKEYLARHGVQFEEQKDLDKYLPQVDIVYMTRTQKERMTEKKKHWAQSVLALLKNTISKESHNSAEEETYAITPNNLGLLRESARLLHPLPHVGEINLPLETEENDPRVGYFRQAENGLYVRMAILENLIG